MKLDKYSVSYDKKAGKKLIKNMENLKNYLNQEVEGEASQDEEEEDTTQIDQEEERKQKQLLEEQEER